MNSWDWKETILKVDHESKFITLCWMCDKLKKFYDKWKDKDYDVLYSSCSECLKIEFKL